MKSGDEIVAEFNVWTTKLINDAKASHEAVVAEMSVTRREISPFLWGKVSARSSFLDEASVFIGEEWADESRELQEEKFHRDLMSWYEPFKKEEAVLAKEDQSRFAKLKVTSLCYEN